MNTVADVLRRIGRSGTFAVKLSAPADDVRLEVTGVGRVFVPAEHALRQDALVSSLHDPHEPDARLPVGACTRRVFRA